MVCKRSLYCLKYGPCANDQTRRQIWEDNIKFREHFRAANWSDHYWSFQVTGQSCCCCDASKKPYLRRARFGSLQALDQIDCTSVTHDRGLPGPATPCPLHSSPPIVAPFRKDAATETQSRQGVDKSVGLTPVQPRPNVSLASNLDIPSRYLSQDDKHHTRFKAPLEESRPNRYRSQPNLSGVGRQDSTDSGLIEPPQPRRRPTVSRTTRQTLVPNKTTPFLPFGWNNPSKQTHNVLAGGNVYPNAVTAKQQRQENIKKLLHNEEMLQKAEQNNFKKRVVNHSSLWTTEYNRSYRDTGGDPLPRAQVSRVSTPMPRPAMQPVRAMRRPSSQACFY